MSPHLAHVMAHAGGFLEFAAPLTLVFVTADGPLLYLGLFWAEALAAEGGSFGDEFASLAADLRANEQTIVDELMAAAGTPADVGGYYQPDHAKAEKVMRPSATLNNIIDSHLEGAQQLVA